jgi:hypothetical protein
MRTVVMNGDDFKKVITAMNVLSLALDVLKQHPEIEIKDFDGDPDPGARERWDAACMAGHIATSNAKWGPSKKEPAPLVIKFGS